MPKAWEAQFPALGSWTETSEATREYNCAAFAAGEDHRRWDPFPPGLDYWPPGVARSYALAAFVAAYQTINYAVCADGALEPQREKIAIYTNVYGGVEHIARQLPDGKWTSKIGDHEDIVHDSPASLGGSDYGEPTCFMARIIKTESANGDKTREQKEAPG
jgi:hypothetical protein